MMQQPQGLHPALFLALGTSGRRQLLWLNIRALLPTEVKNICPSSVPSTYTGFTHNSFYVQLYLNLRNNSVSQQISQLLQEKAGLHPFISQKVVLTQDKNSAGDRLYIATSSMSLSQVNHCHHSCEAIASASTETAQVWD